MKQLKLLSRLIPQLSAFLATNNYPLPSTPTECAGLRVLEAIIHRRSEYYEAKKSPQKII